MMWEADDTNTQQIEKDMDEVRWRLDLDWELADIQREARVLSSTHLCTCTLLNCIPYISHAAREPCTEHVTVAQSHSTHCTRTQHNTHMLHNAQRHISQEEEAEPDPDAWAPPDTSKKPGTGCCWNCYYWLFVLLLLFVWWSLFGCYYYIFVVCYLMFYFFLFCLSVCYCRSNPGDAAKGGDKKEAPAKGGAAKGKK